MSAALEKTQKIIFFTALFTLIALWNIPNTIAGRYISGGVLLLTLFLLRPSLKAFFLESKVLVIFFIYLVIHLVFFSTNFPMALKNFRGEWMEFILFSIAGAGAGMVIGKMKLKETLLYLGVSFSIPLFIHLILISIKFYITGSIPWKYVGISETHGPLSYAALQASILLFTYLIFQAKTIFEKTFSMLLIGLCVGSPLLAGSRGGIVFVLLSLTLIYLTYLLSPQHKKLTPRKKYLGTICICGVVIFSVLVGINSDPKRWEGLSSRFAIGLAGNPIKVYCKGIPYLVDELVSKEGGINENERLGIESVINGDGARVMAARAGVRLVAKNPMGINQSKEAYQIAITKECGTTPMLFISHTHNAWLDTALAIGIPGAALLFLVMLMYAIKGYRTYKGNIEIAPYGLALFISSTIWIIRGLVDATQRDQMLEIQAFMFALLLGLILSKERLKTSITS